MKAFRKENLCLSDRVKEAIYSHKIVLFMKGTIKFPLCGLSSDTCTALKKCNLEFKSIDILEDPELYLFLREAHNPSVAPYLYVRGKFVGGYDEILSMLESHEIGDIFDKHIK